MGKARERLSPESSERAERDQRWRTSSTHVSPVPTGCGLGLDGIGNRALLSLLHAGGCSERPRVSLPGDPREHAASGAPQSDVKAG